MNPQNPFRNAQGKSVNPFTMEAEAWDMGYDFKDREYRKNSFRVDEHLFNEEDLLTRIRQLTKPNQPYMIYVRPITSEKPQN